MQISIEVPDELASSLEDCWGDPPRHLFEDLAADGYRQGLLTAAQVGRLLGIEKLLAS